MFTINLDSTSLLHNLPGHGNTSFFYSNSAPLVVFWHNSRFQSDSFAIFQGVTIGAVIIATVTLKNKKHLGSGNFEYTFECFCSPKPLKEIKVTSGNDNEAQALAQIECDQYCTGTEE
jgi:hypothetical protein